MTSTIRSSDLVRELTAAFGSCPVTARKAHELVLDGRIPATRGTNGRFDINRSDLPAIAEIVGITERAA